MTVRLKDSELQKKLDEISGGDFSKALMSENISNYGDSDVIDIYYGDQYCYPGSFTKKFSRHHIRLFKSEIEQVNNYDPTKWNLWPEVTPPYNVLMRAEVHGEGNKRWTCGVYIQAKEGYRDYWAHVFGGQEDDDIDDQWDPGVTIRFRPWDDDDGTSGGLHQEV